MANPIANASMQENVVQTVQAFDHRSSKGFNSLRLSSE
jgi:hypothetical protein